MPTPCIQARSSFPVRVPLIGEPPDPGPLLPGEIMTPIQRIPWMRDNPPAGDNHIPNFMQPIRAPEYERPAPMEPEPPSIIEAAPFRLPSKAPRFSALEPYLGSLLCRAASSENANQGRDLLTWAGPVTGYTRFAPTESGTPGGFFGFLPDRMIVAVHGTRSAATLIEQVSAIVAYDQEETAHPPYRGHPQWIAYGEAWADRIRGAWSLAGKPPLDLFGHSLGAATIAAAYVNLLEGEQRPRDRLWCYGAPNFATQSMRPYLRYLGGLSMINPGDPLALMPPPANFYPLGALVASVIDPANEDYGPYQLPYEIDSLGGFRGPKNFTEDALTYGMQVIRFLAGGIDFRPHYLREYAASLYTFAVMWMTRMRQPMEQLAALEAIHLNQDSNDL